jgi:hypothetical protein
MDLPASDGKVNDRDIVASGAVVIAPGEVLVLSPSEIKRRVRILFVTEKAVGYRINAGVEGDLITLSLINFDNPIGIAPLQAMPVGKLNGRDLFFAFAVHAIGSGTAATRVFSYTFSLAPAAKPMA